MDHGYWELHELLVPFLSMCTALGIGNDIMRHHIPWERYPYIISYGCLEWMDMFDYLHVKEGWQLSDFSNFLGCHGTIKACLQFPYLVEGNLIYLLLEHLSLMYWKTQTLDLFPRLF